MLEVKCLERGRWGLVFIYENILKKYSTQCHKFNIIQEKNALDNCRVKLFVPGLMILVAQTLMCFDSRMPENRNDLNMSLVPQQISLPSILSNFYLNVTMSLQMFGIH